MKLYILLSLVLASVYCEDLVWTSKSPMPTARSDFSATTVGDVIYLAGGCASDQVCPPGPENFCFCQILTNKTEAYHPLTDSWVTLADMPRQRYRHATAAIGSKLYLIGGRNLEDYIINEIDVYDIPSNTWSTISSLYTWANATSDLTVTTIGTKIYAVGGYTQDYVSLATTWVLDTALPLPRWQSNVVSPMSQNRGDACAVAIDNLIYVFGGFSDTNFCAALGSLEIYNVDTNEWSVGADLHFPRGDGACAVQHGKLHVIGGEVKDSETNCTKYSVAVSHVEYFVPAENKWNDETEIPQVRFRFGAAAWGNNFYVFGGQSALKDDTYPVVNTVLAVEDTTPSDISNASLLVNSLFVSLLFVCLLVL